MARQFSFVLQRDTRDEMKFPALARWRESALDEQFDAEWGVNASVGEDEDFGPNKKRSASIRSQTVPRPAAATRCSTIRAPYSPSDVILSSKLLCRADHTSRCREALRRMLLHPFGKLPALPSGMAAL